ncbi:GTP-binding protein [Asticcacaulis sp. AC460]|nr:GTP-binding protein [Asticcacaulis sp. AC460]
MAELLFEDEVFRIRGAVFEVYREMGSGFLEAVYQECLEREFQKLGIDYVAHRALNLTYKGEALNQFYRADFVCFDKIILELKAMQSIAPEHRLQLLHYLKATGLRLGLVINFGAPAKVQIERVVL